MSLGDPTQASLTFLSQPSCYGPTVQTLPVLCPVFTWFSLPAWAFLWVAAWVVVGMPLLYNCTLWCTVLPPRLLS